MADGGLVPEEIRQLIESETRKCFGLSVADFIAAAEAYELCWHPALGQLIMLTGAKADPDEFPVCENEDDGPDGVCHYVTIDDTVWPVNLDDVEWQLRYGDPESVRMVVASVVAAYRHLTSPGLRQYEAIDGLKRARRAQQQAPSADD